MDGQMDGRRFPLCSTGLRPLQSRCQPSDRRTDQVTDYQESDLWNHIQTMKNIPSVKEKAKVKKRLPKLFNIDFCFKGHVFTGSFACSSLEKL